MFIGHLAVGFAAKAAAPRTSLGVLVASAIGLDLIWPLLLLAGIERVRIDPGNTAFTPLAFDHYPWSHSLLAAIAWGVAAGGVYGRLARYRAGAVFAGLAAMSHWALDFITHRPDLPLYPGGGARLGLSLWNSVAGTVAVECAMLAGALWIYGRATRARDAAGRWGYAAFVVVVLILYGVAARGAPPPDLPALQAAALGAWLLPLGAWWFDRHRRARFGAAA